MEQITCSATRIIQTRRIFPPDCNAYGFLFGGQLMSWLDEAVSISVSKYSRCKAVTGAVDDIQFVTSIHLDDIIYIEAFISGVGRQSVEVFAKVIGENILTGQRYLAVTSFWTFVLLDHNELVMPKLIAKTLEERNITADYIARKTYNQQQRQKMKQLSACLLEQSND